MIENKKYPMKKIFVIAIDEFAGFEEDSTKVKFITNILSHLGAWENEAEARIKCTSLNLTEFDDIDDSNQYHILEMKIN